MSSDIVKSLSHSCEVLRNAVRSSDNICVIGFSATGKTTLVHKVLSEHPEYLFAYISCDLIPTSSKLYIDIYSSLLDQARIPSRVAPDKIWSFYDFYDSMEELHQKAMRKGFKKIFIVLDRMEAFNSAALSNSVLCLATMPIVRLIFITTGSLRSVLSTIKPDGMRSTLKNTTITISLPLWSREDIIETILEQQPETNQNLYKKFVDNIVCAVYNSTTKDFVELRTFCQDNFSSFEKYYRDHIVELIKKYDGISDDELIDDELIEEFEVDRHKIASLIMSFLNEFRDDRRQLDVGSRMVNFEVDRKVEIDTAMLMIAVYICSCTTPADDRRNFVKLQKKKISGKNQDIKSLTSRPFTLERLLNVHKSMCHLVDGKSTDLVYPGDFSDSTLYSIQKLQDLNIITIFSGDGIDSTTKYRMSNAITRPYIDSLAKLAEFDLDKVVGM